MNIEELLAREAIRYTVSIYNRAVDQGHYDDLARVFTEDAILVVQGGPSLCGIDAIVSGLKMGATRRAATSPGNFQRHHMAAAMIEMQGPNSATGLHYITVISELGFDHAGTYNDEYRKIGDRWLLAQRSARMEWARADSRFIRWLGSASPGSLSGPCGAL